LAHPARLTDLKGVNFQMAASAYLTSDEQQAARFWERVDKLGVWRSHTVADPCWLWTGGRGNGYGIIWWKGRQENAHRIAWILTVGPIPPGQHVLHRCDVKTCCRPSHLFLGSQGDNMRDFTRKGLRQKGEQHHRAKLTAAQVIEIRRRHTEEQASVRQLGAEFAMSRTHIREIIQRRRWAHLD
jgi:HNH endonuclease